MKEIIKHGTEIGVAIFYVTRFKFSGNINFNVERWKNVMREACKQSGNPFTPEIKLVDSSELFQKKGFYLCYKNDTINNIKIFDGEISIFVGPEGGWSEEEVELFDRSKLVPLKLGDNILRTETAAVLGAGLVKYFINNDKR